jgi:hypothetical protein
MQKSLFNPKNVVFLENVNANLTCCKIHDKKVNKIVFRSIGWIEGGYWK